MAIEVENTVGEFVALIRHNIENAPSAIASHNQGLLGPRKRGSTTKIGLEDLPADIPLEWSCKSNGADVYIGYAEKLEGCLGADSLGQVLAKGLLVSIRKGAHGPELYVNQSPNDVNLPEVSLFSVIVGDSEGVHTVFTWHPGYILSPFDGQTLTKDTAVKLHNGE